MITSEACHSRRCRLRVVWGKQDIHLRDARGGLRFVGTGRQAERGTILVAFQNFDNRGHEFGLPGHDPFPDDDRLPRTAFSFRDAFSRQQLGALVLELREFEVNRRDVWVGHVRSWIRLISTVSV